MNLIRIIILLLFIIFNVELSYSQNMKFEIDGPIKIGDYQGVNPDPGTIRWNTLSNDFEGWDGISWKSLTTNAAVNSSPPEDDRRLGNERWTHGPLWSIDGNTNTFAYVSPPRLGTTDNAPLVFITNNIERLRINADGTIKMDGSLDVGEDAIIGMDLEVKQDVNLNIAGGSTTINGATTLGGPDMNMATFTGPVQMNKTLNVDGNTTLNGTSILGGTGMNMTTYTGPVQMNKTQNVDGAVTLNNSLLVSGPTSLSSSLTVKTLTVDSAATIKDRLNVIKDDAAHVAIFNNTNNGDGDGIKIKLGKAKTEYDLEAVYNTLPEVVRASVEGEVTDATEKIKNLLNSNTTVDDKLVILGEIVIRGTLGDLTLVAGLSVALANVIVDVVNDELGLPYDLSVPINEALDTVSFAVTDGINFGLDFTASTVTNGINTGVDVALGAVTTSMQSGIGTALNNATNSVNGHVNSALGAVTNGINGHVSSALGSVTSGVNNILPGIGTSISGGINSGLTNLTNGITGSLNSQLSGFDIGNIINSSLGISFSFEQILNGICDPCVEDPDDGQPWPSISLPSTIGSFKLPTLTTFPFTSVSPLSLSGLSPLSINPLSSIGISALNLIPVPKYSFDRCS